MRRRADAADAAVRLWRQGLRPVPLHPVGAIIDRPDRGPIISDGKAPIGEGWAARAYADEAELRAVYRRHPGAGVGLALGLAPDGDAGPIDVEVDDPDQAVATLRAIYGAAVPPRTVGWASARGEHRLYWLEPEVAARLLDAGITRAVLDGTRHPCLAGLEVRLGTLDPAKPRQIQSACPPTRMLAADGTPGYRRRYHDADAGYAPVPEALVDYLIAHLGPGARPAVARPIPDRLGLVGLMPTEKFKAQLAKLGLAWTPSGRGFACRCPAHRGRRQNLSFGEAPDGRLLVRCHRGCDFDAILAAAGLEPWHASYLPSGAGARDRPAPIPGGPRASNIDDDEARELSEEALAKLDYQHGRAVAALADDPGRLDELAAVLGVSTGSLARLEVGWREDVTKVDGGSWVGTGDWAWAFPERNGQRDVVGLMRRYEDPTLGKKAVADGRRGLTVPRGWDEGDGPVFLVEGASDTAATLDLGGIAIGRPMAKAPELVVRDLVELLAGDNREIIVVADGDDTGHEGAGALAATLTRRLGRAVGVAEVPGGCKDMREYLHTIATRKGVRTHG